MFAKIARLSKRSSSGPERPTIEQPDGSGAEPPTRTADSQATDGTSPFWALEELISQGCRLEAALAVLAARRNASSPMSIEIVSGRPETGDAMFRLSA